MKLTTASLIATSVIILVIATLFGFSTLDDQEAKARNRALENRSDKEQASSDSGVTLQNPFERDFGESTGADQGNRVTFFRQRPDRDPEPLDRQFPREDTPVPGQNMLPVTFVQSDPENDGDVPPDFFSIDNSNENNPSDSDPGIASQNKRQETRLAGSDKPEPDAATRWLPIDQNPQERSTPEASEYFDLTGQSKASSTATAEVSRQQSDEHRQWLLSLGKEDSGPSSPNPNSARRPSVQSVSSEFNATNLQLSDEGSRYQPAPLQVESLVNGKTTAETREQPDGSTATVSDLPSGQYEQLQIVDDDSLSVGDSGIRIARNPGQPVQQMTSQVNRNSQPISNELQTSRESTVDVGLESQPASESGPSPNEAETEIVGWPLPESLLPELDHLVKFQATSKWAEAAMSTYQKLNQLELSDPDSLPLTMHCEQLAGQLDEYSRQLLLSDSQYLDSCTYMSRVAYRMERRAKIWKQVHLLAVRQLGESPQKNGQVVAQQISTRSSEISIDNIDPLWADYLMLQRAEEIFADSRSSPTRKQAIARKILARVTSKSLNNDQALYAQQLIGEELGDVLRTAAISNLDLGTFLSDIEGHESKPSTSSTARLNSHFQNFYWSRDDDVQELSDTLDNHYRNANVRLEFSQRLLNQMIPSGQSFQQPVKDRILGANVLGHSRITNQIHLQLVPDPEHLSFRLQSDGRVLSKTRAHARGFVFSNLGNALVNASKTIAVGADGISLTPTNVRASSRNRVTDIQSNVDGVPIVGWLARRMAHQQQQSQDHQAKQIVDQKLRNEFRQRVDEEIQQRVTQARQWVQNNVLRPLNTMELEPAVVRLQTTTDSAIVRYRLAGLDQNAADTPRPQSQPGSLASFQMHRSAVNNIINRIHINGKRFTPGEFAEHLNVLLGRDDLGIPEGQHDDVQFEFAGRDAIQLDFRENRIAISLRLKKLAIGKFGRWRNLTVTAHYTPTTSGTHVFMRFDEQKGLSVRGYKLKLPDQLAVRTVFSTLFKPEFDFPLLPREVASRPAIQGLGISQVILSDGWLGISLDLQHQTENLSPTPVEPSSAVTAFTISDQPGYQQYAFQEHNRNRSPSRQGSQARPNREFRFRHWR